MPRSARASRDARANEPLAGAADLEDLVREVLGEEPADLDLAQDDVVRVDVVVDGVEEVPGGRAAVCCVYVHDAGRLVFHPHRPPSSGRFTWTGNGLVAGT